VQHIDIGQALKDFISHRVSETPIPARQAPLVCVDECLNRSEIRDTILQLMARGLALGSMPLWPEKRLHPDGSPFYVWGGYNRSGSNSPFRGAPAKEFSWSDNAVAFTLVAQFSGVDHVVLLSENRRRNIGGLARVLRDDVQKVLCEEHQNRFRLDVYMKRGKTAIDRYCRGVIESRRKLEGEPGYYEHVI
jgi:hypothetical protein